MTPAAPLHQVRVVDLSWLLPGPFCTSLLADLGADVLKIERPGDGDYARDLLPGLFRLVNRGKRSAVFDLQTPHDRERLLQIAASADIFVEGFRPGVVDRLGVGYAQVRKRNPKIIYVSISGYGQVGALASQPGHDINFCAEAGLLAIPSSVDQERPYRMQLPVSDIAGSMYAALSAVAALRQRDATGQGAHVDVSLAECAFAWSALRWADAPSGTQDHWKHVSPGNDLFRAADGEWLATALVEEKFWTGFCRAAHALGARAALDPHSPPRADAPREARLAQRSAIAEAIAQFPSAAWIAQAHAHDLPITRVAQAFAKDSMPDYPVRLPGLRAPSAAPALGAENARLAANPAAAWES
jgi:crotonobetainyl-CoA:carnitine CoA-transferase CaiB-like acyl-CoA transferase